MCAFLKDVRTLSSTEDPSFQTIISNIREILSSDEEKRKRQLAAWGVQSLPWLILTDKDRVVRAEGFQLAELDKKLQELDAGSNPRGNR